MDTFLKIILSGLIIIFTGNDSLGQVLNDECFTAINIDNLSDFCSSGFSNAESTLSDQPAPSCWVGEEEENDVWYSFVPTKAGMLLRFFGSGGSTQFTIDNVGLALYASSGDQLEELDCLTRVQGSDDIFERIYTDLVIGRIHYIRIGSRSNQPGTFQLCLSDFIPVPQPEQDCPDAVILCDKNTFVVERIEGVGSIMDEARGSCLDGLSPDSPPGRVPDPTESSSVWYKWTAATSGPLTFTLTPNNDDPEEDLDFALYRLPAGLNDCANKELLLCMASGAPFPQDDPCRGPTGLREGESDMVEYQNCEDGSNNFLSPLNMIAGESYALIVNNFSQSGFGFTIEFGGQGEFLGPEPDFQFTTSSLECDQVVTFEDLSFSATDPIVSYEWQFGEGATPESAQGIGPHDVVYESFGDKIAVLVVETMRGCRTTKILELDVEACCDPNDDLTINAEGKDLSCFESMDGTIQVNVSNGTPDYLFSFDDGPLLPRDFFNGLEAGSYSISALDRKGCMATIDVDLEQPLPIDLFLTGPRDTVRLGQGGQLFSDFEPDDRILDYMWTPPEGLSCTDCPNPEVIPPGTTIYTLTVEDQDGCIFSEDIIVFTTSDKPFLAPNIISLTPLTTGNSLFKVTHNEALEIIEYVAVYDRWGNELYREEGVSDILMNYEGWSGFNTSTNKFVNPGVYVWIARARFIDREVLTFAGDLTVVH